jgi:rare lipoprotein A
MVKSGIRRILLFLLFSWQIYNATALSSSHDTLSEKMRGIASYYAQKFEGKKTASGDLFRQEKLTAACNKLPLGTQVRVRNLNNHKTVDVLVNDRLAPHNKRIIDLSKAAARKLDMLGAGLIKVEIVVLKRP